MKKLFFTFVLMISAVSFTFSQEVTEIANSKGTEALKASKKTGKFTFTLPDHLTKGDVEKSAKYYTHYFSVAFNEGNHVASINMIENTERNRIIIGRFLTSSGIRYVKVGSKLVELNTFINEHLK